MQVPSSLWILSLFIVIGVGIAAAVLTTDVSIQQYTLSLVYCIIDVGASLQEHFDWLHSIVSAHALAC